jgi:hypothetical protein
MNRFSTIARVHVQCPASLKIDESRRPLKWVSSQIISRFLGALRLTFRPMWPGQLLASWPDFLPVDGSKGFAITMPLFVSFGTFQFL